MSYLTLPDGVPDFSKVVLSLWFRVPTSSMIAAIAQANADPPDPRPRLSGVIPLVTWGPLVEGYKVLNNSGTALSYTETSKFFDGANYITSSTTTHPYSNIVHAIGAATEINPSMIGVRCREDEGVVGAKLMIRIQMNDFGAGSWVDMDTPVTFGNKTILTSVVPPIEGATAPPKDTAWSYPFNACMQDYVAPEGPWNVSHGAVDITTISAQQYGPDSFDFGNDIPIVPDHWHHLLLSVDLSLGLIHGTGRKVIYDQPDCTVGDSAFDLVTVSDEAVSVVTNPAKMWVALDDVDFMGEGGVSGYAGSVAGIGNNDVAPQYIYRAAAVANAATTHRKSWDVTGCVQMWAESTAFEIPYYEYTPSLVPSDGHALGIPAVPAVVGRIHPVEMAELQIFTNVTLDTADTAKRRAFIGADGRPVAPAEAEALLGRKPDVLLHGSGHWIHGINTGPPGVPDPGTGLPIPDPAKALTPTGKIVAYTPDPSLGGDQGPSPSLLTSQAASCQ